MEAQHETTFYQDNSVLVTQSRYITESKTYAMRNISSVHIFEIEKNRIGPVLIIVFGIPFLFSRDVFWIGLILIAVGVLRLFSIKNEYSVRISTNAGEANSLVSKNREYIQTIVNALNEAIIHRG
ncbi:DUF6232 family protein [Chryseobacterium paridis]|uniref:QacE n=1 Tax=Chryseobacterium paridis TaxID=2800328 RepID=A0ABS1FR16_9FLAO|nr:DUF6232 family protein [Chryseobacterium paridis]MBK1894867.1 hypothetical protein [Chryseobacterium paridis]